MTTSCCVQQGRSLRCGRWDECIILRLDVRLWCDQAFNSMRSSLYALRCIVWGARCSSALWKLIALLCITML